jgi:hypothetical protein
MEQTKVAKQIVHFQKTGVDIAFNAMKMMQDCTEVATGKLFLQNGSIAKDGCSFVDEWMTRYKKGQEDLCNMAPEQMDPKVLEMQRQMTDQIQTQAKVFTNALMRQADQVFQNGAQLYSNGLEMKNMLQETCKQSIDAAFNTVEGLLGS